MIENIGTETTWHEAGENNKQKVWLPKSAQNCSETETLQSNNKLLHTAFNTNYSESLYRSMGSAVTKCGIITPNIKKIYAMTRYRYIV